MIKRLILLVVILSSFGCEEEDNSAFLELDFIKEFPQKVIVGSHSKNFVDHFDTLQIKDLKDRKIPLSIEMPQYISLLIDGKVLHVYVQENEQLKIYKENDVFSFKGKSEQENSFLEELKTNKDLRNKDWDYNSSFDEFKFQVDDFTKTKNDLMSKFIDEENYNYFYNLQLVESKSQKNSAYLDYIRSRMKSNKDSLFLQYFDVSLLNFDELRPYLASPNLRSFYSRKGIEYFLIKKYGDKKRENQTTKELALSRANIIATSFPQPLKSILLYNDFKYYPEEFDFFPDSLGLTPPLKLYGMFKEDLEHEAYSQLISRYEAFVDKKEKYASGQLVPSFTLMDESSQTYDFNVKNFDKLILIDVWASWCGPCITNFPKVNELQKKYKDNLEVISISIDSDIDSYIKALQTMDVPGNLKLYSENGPQGEFSEFFQTTAIPRYILIDENGKIIDADIQIPEVKEYLERSNP